MAKNFQPMKEGLAALKESISNAPTPEPTEPAVKAESKAKSKAKSKAPAPKKPAVKPEDAAAPASENDLPPPTADEIPADEAPLGIVASETPNDEGGADDGNESNAPEADDEGADDEGDEEVILSERLIVKTKYNKCGICRHLQPTMPTTLPKKFGGNGKAFGQAFSCYDEPGCPAQHVNLVFYPFNEEKVAEAVKDFMATSNMTQLQSLYDAAMEVGEVYHTELADMVKAEMSRQLSGG